MTPIIRTAGCVCGAVRLTLTGEPRRIGLCHCLRCRRPCGRVQSVRGLRRDQVRIEGETAPRNTSFGPPTASRLPDLAAANKHR